MWRLLPYRWLPNPKSTVWVAAFDPDDGHVVSQLRTQHANFGLATGVVETPGRLWLGRIGGTGVGYLPLHQLVSATSVTSVTARLRGIGPLIAYSAHTCTAYGDSSAQRHAWQRPVSC